MSDATTALAEVLRGHEWEPGKARSRHDAHEFHAFCEVCSGNLTAMAAVVVAAVRGLSPDLQAELAPTLAEQIVQLRAIKEGLESDLTKALTRMSEVRW